MRRYAMESDILLSLSLPIGTDNTNGTKMGRITTEHTAARGTTGGWSRLQ